MIDRRGLLRTAAAVYLALTALACGLAWLASIELGPLLAVDLKGLAIGVAAVVPMSAVFFIAPDLKDRVVDLLGPALAECRLWELMLLAGMAGVSEEILFRGTIEGWLLTYDVVLAAVVTNLLFGAMHPITVAYFIIATGFGFYFSVLANLGPERNLTAPIVAHTVYDLVGFMLVARDYRKETAIPWTGPREPAATINHADQPEQDEPTAETDAAAATDPQAPQDGDSSLHRAGG